MEFITEIGNEKFKFSLEEIFIRRNNPNLQIFCEVSGVTLQLSYDKFSKLANVRKILMDLEQNSTLFESAGTSVSENKPINKHKPKMDAINFLKFASSMVRPFSEDAKDLQSFVDNINLVKSLASPELIPNLLEFTKGRLSGKARTSIIGCTSIEEIIVALERDFTLESSIVLESRLCALRFDFKNLTEFASEAEKVADNLKDALISEGCSRQKANEMTVRLVVETCRKSARNDTVKTILASSTFNSAKEVLSKFRIEITEANRDKQFLAFQKQPVQRYAQSQQGTNNYNRFNNRNNNGFNHRNNNGYNNRNGQAANYNYNSNSNWNQRNNYNRNYNTGGSAHTPIRNQQNVRVVRGQDESENDEASAHWPTEREV